MPSSLHDSQNRPDESRPNAAIGSDLLSWASWVMARGGLSPARHHCLLLEQLDLVCRGEVDRLMVLMPPGSAKSTYALAYNVVANAGSTGYTMIAGHGLYPAAVSSTIRTTDRTRPPGLSAPTGWRRSRQSPHSPRKTSRISVHCSGRGARRTACATTARRPPSSPPPNASCRSNAACSDARRTVFR
jgi:hypothetical protein